MRKIIKLKVKIKEDKPRVCEPEKEQWKTCKCKKCATTFEYQDHHRFINPIRRRSGAVRISYKGLFGKPKYAYQVIEEDWYFVKCPVCGNDIKLGLVNFSHRVVGEEIEQYLRSKLK